MAVLCCMLAKRLFPRIVKYSRFNMDVAIDWLPVNLLFIAMLMTGFFSLKALAVPMVTIFKNLTNVAILAGDWSAPSSSLPGRLAATPLTRRSRARWGVQVLPQRGRDDGYRGVRGHHAGRRSAGGEE